MSDSAISSVDTMGNEQTFSDADKPHSTADISPPTDSVVQTTEPIHAVDAYTFPHKNSVMLEDPGREFTPADDIPSAAWIVRRATINPQSSKSDTEDGSDNLTDTVVENDTTVEEEIMEPVVQEVVNATKVDFEHSKIDKEIFEDEYHTTVQNIVDKQDLEEQSIHRVATLQEIVHDEGKAEDEAALQAYRDKEAGDFAAQRRVNEVSRKSTVVPAVISERHHYHIHERIQPIIKREVNQTTVIHTTRPFHEVYYRPSHFTHQIVLPTISMEQYRKQQRDKAEAAKAKARANNNEQEGGNPESL